MAVGDSWDVVVRIIEKEPKPGKVRSYAIGTQVPVGLPPDALASAAAGLLVSCAHALQGGAEFVIQRIADDAIRNVANKFRAIPGSLDDTEPT